MHCHDWFVMSVGIPKHSAAVHEHQNLTFVYTCCRVQFVALMDAITIENRIVVTGGHLKSPVVLAQRHVRAEGRRHYVHQLEEI